MTWYLLLEPACSATRSNYCLSHLSLPAFPGGIELKLISHDGPCIPLYYSRVDKFHHKCCDAGSTDQEVHRAASGARILCVFRHNRIGPPILGTPSWWGTTNCKNFQKYIVFNSNASLRKFTFSIGIQSERGLSRMNCFQLSLPFCILYISEIYHLRWSPWSQPWQQGRIVTNSSFFTASLSSPLSPGSSLSWVGLCSLYPHILVFSCCKEL